MVDAPCSGEGMFRKDDTALEEWSEENVLKCAQRQKEILENASLAVKNGGYIVYATCTFSLEENEMVIDSFLSRHPDFEIVPVSERVRKNTSPGLKFEGCQCENIDLAVRFYPHKGRGEGQFAAVLRSTKEKPRSENTEAFNKKTPNTKAPDKAVFDFLDSVLEKYDKSHVLVYKDSPVYFTPDFYVPKGIAFSCGVTIGEVKKNYILPHHQFFMAMGDSFKRKINLSRDSEELRKYISGESFAADCENGWAAVTVDGCTVGGVKVVDGQAKNHYPKGLRGTLSL